MKTIQQLSCAVMMVSATAAVCVPVLRHLPEWRVSLCEPDTFLLAFTLVSTAILLWPRSEHKAV